MAVEERESVTRALVEAVRGIRYDEIPPEACETAHHCLLDFLGVALAGSQEPLTEILVGEVVRGEAAREAGIIGRPERATRLTAALVNGAAGHALDFDDTHTAMMGHPSVPVLSALLVLAETEGADGRALLAALVAGVELECRVGALLGGGHYAAGFHTTGTVGTFGAAAACAHLMGLDQGGWLHALGLAGTQAAGLKSGFGTMAKPLHAGRAASAGLLSALLARGGFSAQPAILEVPQGFLATHAGVEPSTEVLARHKGQFLIRDTLFKYHASCHLTHATIEAAAQLRERYGLDPEKIGAVEVRVAPPLLDVCNIEEPTTGLEGKFSLRATTALALLGEDTSDLATYSDAKMAEPRPGCAPRSGAGDPDRGPGADAGAGPNRVGSPARRGGDGYRRAGGGPGCPGRAAAAQVPRPRGTRPRPGSCRGAVRGRVGRAANRLHRRAAAPGTARLSRGPEPSQIVRDGAPRRIGD